MTLEAIAYVSSATGSMTEPELEALLLKARAKNREAGVTGVLLFHDGSFFQYFEGPTEGVQSVYDRILASPLHQGITELMRSSTHDRAFGNWQMGLSRAPRSTILGLSNASWLTEKQRGSSSPAVPVGMSLLLEFWKTFSGRHAA